MFLAKNVQNKKNDRNRSPCHRFEVSGYGEASHGPPGAIGIIPGTKNGQQHKMAPNGRPGLPAGGQPSPPLMIGYLVKSQTGYIQIQIQFGIHVAGRPASRWGPMGPHGAPRGPMGPRPVGSHGAHGAPWGPVGSHWPPYQIYLMTTSVGAPWGPLGPRGIPPAPVYQIILLGSSVSSVPLVRVTPTKHRYLLHLVLLHAQNTAIYRTWCF